MRLLLDENVPHGCVPLLEAHGWDVVHVRALGMSRSSDLEILAVAEEEGRAVVSADSDFGDLVRASGASSPSIVFLRLRLAARSTDVAAVLIRGLSGAATDLEQGAVVVLTDTSRRVRRLPIEDES